MPDMSIAEKAVMKMSASKMFVSRAACAIAAAIVICIGLSSCTVGPGYHKAPAPTPAAPNYKESPVNFQDAEGWKVASPQDQMLRGNWWEVFQQPELNDLEKQLNINNQTIKQYFENYLAARAVIRETRAQYYPNATIGAGFSRTRTSGTLSSGASKTGGSSGATASEFSLPLDVSWAPDLFGRVRNAVRSAQASAQVSAADLENERLLEQATLAEVFFEIRGQDELQRILDETVMADEEVLNSVQAQYDVGTGNQVSVEQARQTLESARASATNVKIARAQYEHAIATLLGKAASDFSMPVKPLTAEPPPIPTGAPSQLLERRPDIAAAERQMAAANCDHRHRLCRVLSFADIKRERRTCFFRDQQALQRCQPRVVSGPVRFGDTLRRRITARDHRSIHSDLQRRRRKLPANRAHSVSASGGLPRINALALAGNSRRQSRSRIRTKSV